MDIKNWPANRLIDTEEVCWLTGVSLQTLHIYFYNLEKYGHLIPPGFFKLPGSRRWKWWLHDVLAWIEQHRRGAVAPVFPLQRRGPGKPKGSTKREMARRAAERAAQAGGA